MFNYVIRRIKGNYLPKRYDRSKECENYHFDFGVVDARKKLLLFVLGLKGEKQPVQHQFTGSQNFFRCHAFENNC